mmetsp:Transcript_12319/g.23032  ORF Transcript_12319/g.23032 Transcript_12319/m.23032 type:complete len:2958 (-) Transcript_12319:91-8964(-)
MTATGTRVLQKGSLGVIRKGKVDNRYFVLFEDRLDYFQSAEDFDKNGELRGRLALSDIEELEVLDEGFRIVLSGTPPRTLELQVLKRDDLQQWVDALEPLLEMEGEDEAGNEVPDDSTEEVEEEVLYEGPLGVDVRGKVSEKHFWLFSDRLEWTNKEDETEAQEQYPFNIIQDVSLTDAGFTVLMTAGRLKLQTNRKAAESWRDELLKAMKEFEQRGGKRPSNKSGGSAKRPSKTSNRSGAKDVVARGGEAQLGAPAAALKPNQPSNQPSNKPQAETRQDTLPSNLPGNSQPGAAAKADPIDRMNNDPQLNRIKRQLKDAHRSNAAKPWATLFKAYDRDGKGEISLEQFKVLVRQGAKIRESELPDKDLELIFATADTSRNGLMSYKKEFLAWLMSERAGEKDKEATNLSLRVRYNESEEEAAVKRKLLMISKRNGIEDWAPFFATNEDEIGGIDFMGFYGIIRGTAQIPADQLSDDEVRSLFTSCDADGNGLVNYMSEFITWLNPEEIALFNEKDSASLAQIKRKLRTAARQNGAKSWSTLFKLADKRGDGGLDTDGFNIVIRDLARVKPSQLSNEELRTIWQSADANSDGRVDYRKEFLPWMNRDEKAGMDLAASSATVQQLIRKETSEISAIKIKLREAAEMDGFVGCSSWRMMFMRHDRNSSGALDLSEFRRMLRRGMKITARMLTDQEIASFFNFMSDKNQLMIRDFLAYLFPGEDEPTEAANRLIRSKENAFCKGVNTIAEIKQNIKAAHRKNRAKTWAALFKTYDTNNSGDISLKEFKAVLREGANITPQQCPDQDITELFESCDVDNDNCICYKKEFMPWLREPDEVVPKTTNKRVVRQDTPAIMQIKKRLNGAAYTNGAQDWKKLFKNIDKNKSGTLEFDEFRKVVRVHGKVTSSQLPEEDLRALYDFVDTNSTGSIDLDEFLLWIVLSEATVSPALSPRPAAAAEQAVEEEEDAPVVQGQLSIARKGKNDARFFCLFSDTLEYWSNKDDYESGLERRGCVFLSDIAKLQELSSGFLIHLKIDSRQLDLRTGSEQELERWLRCWSSTLAAIDPNAYQGRQFAQAEQNFIGEGVPLSSMAKTKSESNREVARVKKKLTDIARSHAAKPWPTLFRKYDRDDSGDINFAEFKQVVREGAQVPQSDLSDEDLQVLFMAADKSHDGSINYKTEFLPWLKNNQQQAYKKEVSDVKDAQQEMAFQEAVAMAEGTRGTMDAETLAKRAAATKKKMVNSARSHGAKAWPTLFRNYDRDDSGEIDFKEFLKLIREGAKIKPAEISDEDLLILFDTADRGHDGNINYKREFLPWLNNKEPPPQATKQEGAQPAQPTQAESKMDSITSKQQQRQSGPPKFDGWKKVNPRLQVSLLSASSLRRARSNAAPDAYCAVEIRGKPNTYFQSNVVRNSAEPTWEQETYIENYRAGDEVQFYVKDQDGEGYGYCILTDSELYPDGFEGEVYLDGSPFGQEATLSLRIGAVKETSIICQGELGILKKGAVESRHFVLFADRFEYYSSVADYRSAESDPRGMIALEDVSDFVKSSNGFLLYLGQKSVQLQATKPEEFEMWSRAWDRVFNFTPAEPSEDSPKRRNSEPKKRQASDARQEASADVGSIPAIQVSPPEPMSENKQVAAVKKILTDAARSHAAKPWPTLFRKFDKDGSGDISWDEFILVMREGAKIEPKEISDQDLRLLFQSADKGGDGSINYKKEFLPWLAANHAKMVDTPKLAAEPAAEEQRRPPSSQEPPPSQEAAESAEQASADAPQALLQQGVLSIDKKGKLEQRYFVLYENRLDYYTAAADMVAGQEPRGRVMLREVTQFDTDGTGFSINLGKRQIVLQPEPAGYQGWSAAWETALAKHAESLQPKAAEGVPQDVNREAQVLQDTVRDRSLEPPREQPRELPSSAPTTKEFAGTEIVSETSSGPQSRPPEIEVQTPSEPRTGSVSSASAWPSAVSTPPRSAPGIVGRENMVYEGPMSLSEGGSQAEPKYFALFRDSLAYWSDSGTAQSGVEPQERFLCEDFEDLGVMSNGFDIRVAGRNLQLRCLTTALMDYWIQAFNAVLGGGDEGPVEEPDQGEALAMSQQTILPEDPGQPAFTGRLLIWQGMLEVMPGLSGGFPQWKYFALYSDSFCRFDASNDMASGREPTQTIELASISRVEFGQFGFTLWGKNNYSMSLKVSKEPGALEAWATAWKKCPVDYSGGIKTPGKPWLEDSPSSPGSRRNNRLLRPSAAPPDEIVQQGQLEIERANEVSMRWVILSRSRVLCFKEKEHVVRGDRPKTNLKLSDVNDIKVINQGFMLQSDALTIRLHAWSPKDFDTWKEAFGDVFYLDGGGGTGGNFGDIRDMLQQGQLHLVSDNRQLNKRFFMLYPDRLECYSGSGQNLQPDTKGQVAIKDIRGFKVQDEGFVIRLEQGELELKTPGPRDLEAWLSAFRVVFTTGGIPKEAGTSSSGGATGSTDRMGATRSGRMGRQASSTSPRQGDGRERSQTDQRSQTPQRRRGPRPDETTLVVTAKRKLRARDWRQWHNHFKDMTPKSRSGYDYHEFVKVIRQTGLKEDDCSDREINYVFKYLCDCSGKNVFGFKHDFLPWLFPDLDLESAEVSEEDMRKEAALHGGDLIHSGTLGIQHGKALVKKYFGLWPDRLDYFDSARDMANPPRGRIALTELLSVEMFGMGFIMNLLGRKVGVKADNHQDAKIWFTWVMKALEEMPPHQRARLPDPVSGSRARSTTPRRKWRDVRPRVYDDRNVSCPHCGGAKADCSPERSRNSQNDNSRSDRLRPERLIMQKCEKAPNAMETFSLDDVCAFSLVHKTAGKEHADNEGWVTISTFDRWRHDGGRFWRETGVTDDCNKREISLKDAWHPNMFTVTNKITYRPRNGEYRRDEPFYEKLNVPEPLKRVTVKQLNKEREERHVMPPKITAANRTFKIPQGPDVRMMDVTGKITDTPAKVSQCLVSFLEPG